jgi:hypothetical protein
MARYVRWPSITNFFSAVLVVVRFARLKRGNNYSSRNLNQALKIRSVGAGVCDCYAWTKGLCQRGCVKGIETIGHEAGSMPVGETPFSTRQLTRRLRGRSSPQTHQPQQDADRSFSS